MFTDLVKGAKSAKKSESKKRSEEISDERLDEIMAELFGGADSKDEDAQKGMSYKKKGMMPRADLLRAMDEDEEIEKGMDEDEEIEKGMDEDEDEEMEKGMSRREMMNKVYSMVDDLSDAELDQFLSSREIKKAQAMAIFDRMSNSDLKDLVSVSAANGEGSMEALNMDKGAGYDMKDMEKGEDIGVMDDMDEFDEE